MTQQDTGQRRRADDLTRDPASTEDLYPGEDRRRTTPRKRGRAPGRSFLRRFKQPIIGLSIVGAAAPLINAGTNAEAGKQAANTSDTAQPTEAELARSGAASSADAEDMVAAKIAEEHGGGQRQEIVTAAMAKFDISQKLAEDIYDIAQEEGIEPEIAYGLVQTESSFNPRATSHVGARGLTQVMPRTGKWMQPGLKTDELYNEKTNLTLGFRYLNQMIEKYRGNVRHALHAYNRGPGTVDKILKRGGNPANGYADKVLGGWKSST